MPASTRIINRWWQLAACMIAMVAIANLQYTWTLFTIPLSQGLHAKLSDVQLAFTLFIVAQSWLVPILGYLVDRFGARIVVGVGGVLVGLSWVGSGMAQSISALYFWYLIGGVGAGAVLSQADGGQAHGTLGHNAPAFAPRACLPHSVTWLFGRALVERLSLKSSFSSFQVCGGVSDSLLTATSV